MPLPDRPALLAAFQRAVADGKTHTLDALCARLASEFDLAESEKPSARCQIGSVRAALVREGLLEAVTSKEFKATPEGLSLQKTAAVSATSGLSSGSVVPPEYPASVIREVFQRADAALLGQVRHHLKLCSPGNFERVVVDLLAAMGYACVRTADSARVVGGPGDGGIDGMLRADPLGFSPLYVQAKKRDGNGQVGATDVRAFVGALQTRGAARGVFVTTGRFSDEALAVCASPRPDCCVVLIDGEDLVRYLIEYNVGVRVKATYEVKEVDEAYFKESPPPPA